MVGDRFLLHPRRWLDDRAHLDVQRHPSLATALGSKSECLEILRTINASAEAGITHTIKASLSVMVCKRKSLSIRDLRAHKADVQPFRPAQKRTNAIEEGKTYFNSRTPYFNSRAHPWQWRKVTELFAHPTLGLFVFYTSSNGCGGSMLLADFEAWAIYVASPVWDVLPPEAATPAPEEAPPA